MRGSPFVLWPSPPAFVTAGHIGQWGARMRRSPFVLWLLPLVLGACTASQEPRLVWEGAGIARAQSITEATLALRPMEPGRDGAAWGESTDATFRLLQTTVAEHPHVHDEHDLTIVILAGHGILTVTGREHGARPGDVLHIGRGRVHWFQPDPSEPVVAVAIFTPRLNAADSRVVEMPEEENAAPTGAALQSR